ncbi:DUF1127 domain-containing protein [Loktanella sp. SALINAS62]|uniref:DUF1127 domain-containing protein n=1 Tax=Loktanella sp. SALINAS62 TaxID=2706124 RepID=UPI001B8B7385|nr:DUF1127 domain-containing protein [Loktanella sp. SALINAS62]MBS1302789.1 DUF1127 domain-containing protein [Loktanella sp. SALINAS62]
MSHALHPAQLAWLDGQAVLPKAAQICVALAVILTVWDLRRRTRKHLQTLEPAQLRDVGLTQGQAEKEAAKPFYQT